MYHNKPLVLTRRRFDEGFSYAFNVSPIAEASPHLIETPHKTFPVLNIQIVILHLYDGGNTSRNLQVFRSAQDLFCLVEILPHVAKAVSQARSDSIAKGTFNDLLEFVDNR